MPAKFRWNARRRRFVERARVAHLATANRGARPYVVPICFALSSNLLYTAIDLKPKIQDAPNLRRLRNIAENPHVTVIVDCYSENWKRLAFVLLHGRASLTDAREARRAIRLLRAKYPQYRAMALEGRPIIKIRLTSAYAWGDL